MSGDYSRITFDPARDFAAVLAEQGRVQTDADWNEAVAAFLRRVQAGSLDTFGPAVVPRETPDGFRIEMSGGNLAIGPGRIYVDGLMAENHGTDPQEWDPRLAELRGTGPTPYEQQLYYPDPPDLPGPGGTSLIYLKVWQREITSVEFPELVEVALGVDTSTRLQTVWQVKFLPLQGSEVSCATPFAEIPGFTEAEPGMAGRLTTDTADVPGDDSPCAIPPSGGYKGLENQLYRVEVHRGGGFGGATPATFKWSRDNATVASRISHIPALDRIVVDSVGRDSVLRFSDGDWVEVTDDWRELNGLPGEMRRIRPGGGVDDPSRTMVLTQALPAGMFPVDAQSQTDPSRNTRVRRWDQGGRILDEVGTELLNMDDAGADGTIPIMSGTRILLEKGVVVAFDLDPAGGEFRTGDHWVFAARTADASVEPLENAPPRGIHAHYAMLAIVDHPDDETDCRTIWPPEFGEGGCDCTVCVTAESHTSGAKTIQAAIDQVKESGGTVCLGTGIYPLREPVRIRDARSVRLKGQGPATILLGASPGALELSESSNVSVKDLAVVAPAHEEESTVSLSSCNVVTLSRCQILQLEEGVGTGIRLSGYVLEATVESCFIVARAGIAGGDRDDGYLITSGLKILDNRLICSDRGVRLGRFSIHLGETRLAGNSVVGGADAGLSAVGGNAATGGFNVTGNQLYVGGDGIVVGVDDARIASNDIRGRSEQGDDGIVLAPGLDPGGMDRCQVLANRIQRMQGHGIAIRTPVNSAMIKQNIVSRVGGGGVVMEAKARAQDLVIENNQLLVTGMGTAGSEIQPAAIRAINVRSLEVAANGIHGFAGAGTPGRRRAAIQALGTRAATIRGNRLTGIGPEGDFTGHTIGIDLFAPFRTFSVLGNSARRSGEENVDLGESRWIGVWISGGLAQQQAGSPATPSVSLGNLALVRGPQQAFLLTETSVAAAAISQPGDVVVQGNQIRAEASTGSPVLVLEATACRFSDNLVISDRDETPPSILRPANVIVANNELRRPGDTDVLRIEGSKQTVVVGNLFMSQIRVNGGALGAPWVALNLEI